MATLSQFGAMLSDVATGYHASRVSLRLFDGKTEQRINQHMNETNHRVVRVSGIVFRSSICVFQSCRRASELWAVEALDHLTT